jgi:hypothetical protein
MSAAQQAKAKRRQMRNGYGHLGSGSIPGKPVYKSASGYSVAQSIARERAQAAKAARIKKK